MILFLVSLTIINIPYELKSEFQKVEFFYSSSGKNWYPIGVHKCPYPSSEIKDTFRWVVKGRAKGDIRIKVVYSSPEKSIERELKDFRVEIKEGKRPDYIYNGRLSKAQDTDTTYSWRMLGYDAQHTGYYPHPLYPPFELKWEYGVGMDGSADYTMVSSSAGNGMLYTRKGSQGSHGINWVAAVDIETGEEVWSRELTSNVWTTVLSPGDSLLFVGTSSGWSRLDSTLFCINPWNGEIIWKLPINSVLYPLTITDSLIFSAVTAIYSVDFTGNILWEMWGDTSVFPPIGFDNSPAYLNNRVYIGGENSALLSLDAYTGETLWVYSTESWILAPPLIYNDKVFISCDFYDSNNIWTGGLYSLNTETGNIVWKKEREQEPLSGIRFEVADDGRVYTHKGYWVVVDSLIGSYVECFNADSGNVLWSKDLFFGETNSPTWVLSNNSIIWITPQWIYGLDANNGNVIYTSDTLEDVNYFQYARFFPILYKNYLIRGYRTKLFLYEGRTTPPDTLNTNSLISIPNPFSSSVQIIGKTDVDILSIYDLLGRRVRNIEGAAGSYGYMYFIWDGRDERGEFCPNGVYIMKVEGLKGKTIYLKRR
ncbi:PQQ-binding-like beta-propeller repeat protein [candidate division WOR-3 bacterium]|nr:PQQ-binding-like beta-propeller repeat protein [candidate division WOR-3 bacterium]